MALFRRASAMMAFFNANHGQPESSGESENSRNHPTTPLTVNNITINIFAYGSLPSQDIVTLDLKLSTATCTDDFPAILREILCSGLPLTATIHFSRKTPRPTLPDRPLSQAEPPQRLDSYLTMSLYAAFLPSVYRIQASIF
ncbi:hypothetical protein IWX90DRAFT_478798 [Phyllosticta citrichinensis]|uniref:Uncharacterized protein n=1 Tax=Phyllosticta citrichinensis TaxID=1130410 RepID=A0ABR1XR19_9PEZI